ncbi:MAG TPA: ABC transporter substrate-binding protein [Candidatus Dormibacteraeota bacterium]|nr:ABC transporter substrate-binding protein [Candidatus Dormibacteraeota bacterium]
MRAKSVVRLRTAAGLAIAAVAIAGCGAAATKNQPKPPVTIGFLGALTGARSSLGTGMELGANLAVQNINSHGGVLGHQILMVAQDTASDPADAVPAADFEINSDHVAAIIGPTANTTAVVLPLADKANIPELMFGGGAAFDQETDPHFFRLSPSDTEQAQAMVYYAHSKGWNKVALAFGEAAASQSLVAPIEASLRHLHMTIVGNVSFTAGQSSYRSEVQQVFANHPQVVLSQFNNTTAGIVFGETGQAGFSSTPWIGTNLWYSSAWVSSVGAAATAGNVYISNSSSLGMAGATQFISLLKAKTGSSIPPNGAGFMYDAVMTWALGADAAGTWAWPKIRAGILKASNPPGTVCGSYQTCYSLLKKDKKINWDGSESTVDFNKYDNVFGPFAILNYNSSGAAQTVTTLTPQALEAAFAG